MTVEAATAVVARHLVHSFQATDAALAALTGEWAARTPSKHLRVLSNALGRSLIRLAAALFPDDPPLTPTPRALPRPVVLGLIAARAGIPADDLVRVLAYDDAQSVCAAYLKLITSDPGVAAAWAIGACVSFEPEVAAIAGINEAAAIPAPGAPLLDQWTHAHSLQARRLFRA